MSSAFLAMSVRFLNSIVLHVITCVKREAPGTYAVEIGYERSIGLTGSDI